MSAASQGFSNRTLRLKADLVEQGRRVQALVEAAFEAVFDRNAERAAWVGKQDDVIDNADVAIERAAVALLRDATSQGAELEESQLRLVLTIVKVNNELERIADVAVDVSELCKPRVGGGGDCPEFPGTFRVMANSVIGIVRDTNTSMLHDDPSLAKVVLASQHTVTAFKSAIVRDCEERIAKGMMPVEFAFQLHEIANLCELLADHCTNIAEQVIYRTTGAIVRHTTANWVEVQRPAAG